MTGAGSATPCDFDMNIGVDKITVEVSASGLAINGAEFTLEVPPEVN